MPVAEQIRAMGISTANGGTSQGHNLSDILLAKLHVINEIEGSCFAITLSLEWLVFGELQHVLASYVK